MQRDDATILDLINAGRCIERFVRGFDRESFAGDEKTQSAVLHQLMVIGEAVKRLSPEFREAHADTPWALIAGMRDRLIHAYDSVDLDEVWRTVSRDIPELLARLSPPAWSSGRRIARERHAHI